MILSVCMKTFVFNSGVRCEDKHTPSQHPPTAQSSTSAGKHQLCWSQGGSMTTCTYPVCIIDERRLCWSSRGGSCLMFYHRTERRQTSGLRWVIFYPLKQEERQKEVFFKDLPYIKVHHESLLQVQKCHIGLWFH